MYIEFVLPTGAGGMAAGHVNAAINRALKEWSIKHDIAYSTKVVKYTKRVTFESDKFYNVFALTWGEFYTPNSSFLNRWRIVSDPNNKTVFDSRV